MLLLSVAVAIAGDTRNVPPERVDPPELPRLARIVEIKAILDEVALPPLPFVPAATSAPHFPFLAERMKHYGMDGTVEDILKTPEKYPLRVAVIRSLDMLRKAPVPGNAKGVIPISQINAPINDKTRREVSKTQDFVALLVAELELQVELLVDLGRLRADEPRRWQAHYDYTLAQLRRRLVLVHEYNKALSDVRTDSMPDLPEGALGWKLVSAEKLHSRLDVKKILEQSTDGFRTLATDCKGTPWEYLANRALLSHPGLTWEPILKRAD
ncbi:MAG: hypothetical protein C0467_13935 [Planctomycetaceae bacterium]|nr:hypothetical protein [Planctomycetaceae bacterium]